MTKTDGSVFYGGSVIRRSAIVGCILLIGSFCLSLTTKSESVPLRRPLSDLPSMIGAWTGQGSVEFNTDTLKALGVDDYTNRIYYGPGGAVIGLYIGYYRSQRQGDTIHSPLNCLPGAGWNPVVRDVLAVPIQLSTAEQAGTDPQFRAIRINRIIIQKGLDKQLVLYWYQSHGRVVASEYWGKIYTVIDAMRTNRTDAALVRIIAPVVGSEKNAENASLQESVDFLKLLFPLLSQYLPN